MDRIGLKEGVPILSVEPGSAAADAGLRPFEIQPGGQLQGDVILQIDGRPVRSSDELYTILQRYDTGDTITLRIWSDGKEGDVKATLKSPRTLQ